MSAHFSWTTFAEVLKITLLPAINTKKLNTAQEAITPVIGSAVSLCRKLTRADVKAPIPSCIAPISADALPAFVVKGAIESAEEFGNVKPWQLRKINMRNILDNKPTK